MAAWQVRISEKKRSTKQIVGWLGDTPTNPSGGGGGYETITLPNRAPVRVWRGRPDLVVQPVSLVLGGAVFGVPVDPMLQVLINMWRPDDPTDEPPVVRVNAEGNTILFQHLDYTISNLEFGDAVANAGQQRVQQALTVELTEHRPDELLTPASKSGAKSKRSAASYFPRTYRVKRGDTISGIARQFKLDDWRDLAAYNRLSDPRELKVGQVLRVPRA